MEAGTNMKMMRGFMVKLEGRTPVEALGTYIRQRRLSAGLSQDELGEKCGMGVKWIRELERGRPAENLKALCELLEVLSGLDS